MSLVRAVSEYFIAKADADAGDLMTHLKLQKLLFYAQGWHLALFGKPLFHCNFEAWTHGPVCIDAWNLYKHRRCESIGLESVKGAAKMLTDETKSFLDEVWRVYGQFSAKRLEDLTHQESPWIEARKGLPPEAVCHNVISMKSMKNHFKKMMKVPRGEK